MRVGMCIYIYIYIYMYICIYAHISVCICLRGSCMHVCMHVYLCMYVCLCMYVLYLHILYAQFSDKICFHMYISQSLHCHMHVCILSAQVHMDGTIKNWSVCVYIC